MQYSLWLIPEEPFRKKYNGLIYELSRKYRTPQFEPHITLISVITGKEKDVVYKTDELAAQTNKFDMEIAGLQTSDLWYKSLFARMRKTAELITLHKRALEIFGEMAEHGDYDPHMSLLYDSIENKDKQQTCNDIKWVEKEKFGVATIFLVVRPIVTEDIKKIKIVGKFSLGKKEL
ncbi:MAG: 2'-5' RNA ligase family protein [Candidatus Aenigmatarchaeota archaeon]